jgi:hypothetical protein
MIADYELKRETTISLSQRPDDMLRHNADFNGVLYKYDLPITNEPITFRNQSDLVNQEEDNKLTLTESLLKELECDKDTAYESFAIKL